MKLLQISLEAIGLFTALRILYNVFGFFTARKRNDKFTGI